MCSPSYELTSSKLAKALEPWLSGFYLWMVSRFWRVTHFTCRRTLSNKWSQAIMDRSLLSIHFIGLARRSEYVVCSTKGKIRSTQTEKARVLPFRAKPLSSQCSVGHFARMNLRTFFLKHLLTGLLFVHTHHISTIASPFRHSTQFPGALQPS